jgi:transcriptional regulator with XRE-family HTH domain
MKAGASDMRDSDSFGAFLKEKRRTREITSTQMCEAAGISIGYFSDIESGRRVPPEREKLDKLLELLRLSDKDTVLFYDLAGKAKSEVSPDLPDYIMENDVVRVALRVAKNKASTDDWKQFIKRLEKKGDLYDD